MLSKSEKRLIRKAFGRFYTSALAALLKKAGFRNAKGEDYSADSIRQIMSYRENLDLEEFFLREAKKELENQQRRQARRSQLLKK